MSAAPPLAAGSRDPGEALLAEFVRSLDRFLDGRLDPLAVDRAHAMPREVLTGLGELGAFGVSLPEEHGGSELGLRGACAVVECIARHDRAVATTVGLHLGLGTRGLVAFGSDAQKRRWLPELAAGTTLAAFATTEPGAGSDLSRLATTATVDPADAARLEVRGQKIYVTNGGLAGLYTITASTPGLGGESGQSLVALERGDAGVVVGKEEEKLGLRGSSTTTLYIEATVPVDRIVGEAGQGSRELAHVLAWGRTIMASGCAGTARAAFDKAVEHVKTRRQFGKTLSQQTVVRDQVAEMAAELFAMRALIGAAAAAADGLALDDPQALERRSLAAKIYASEADWRICDTALQLHGGSGYIEESGVPLLLRDARITRIFEGANDVLAGRLGLLALMTKRAVETDDGHDVQGLVAESCADLTRRKGLGGVRDARALHRIGRLTALAEAAAAVVGRVRAGHLSTRDAALAAHALAVLSRRARAEALAATDGATSDPIANHLLDGADA